MGWIHLPKPRNIKEFLTNELNYENKEDKVRRTVLDCAIVNFRTAYMALEVVEEHKTYHVGVVVLLDYRKGEVNDFGFKILDETMGPYERAAPYRILTLIGQSEPLNYSAREWREGCWKNIRLRQGRKLKKVEGTKLVSRKPEGLQLREELFIREFETTWAFTRKGRRQTVLSGGGHLWKITNWLLDQLEIVE